MSMDYISSPGVIGGMWRVEIGLCNNFHEKIRY
jgi:hypothetical protein